MKKIFISIIILPNMLFPNNCNVSIEEMFFNEDIIGYYLSAIDIQSGESNVLLFDYSIDFSNCDVDELDNALDVYFKIDMYVPTFESYSNAPQPLTEGTVNLTQIPDDLQQLEFRNTDLSFGTQYLQGGTQFDLYQENYSVFISDSDIDELTDVIMGQGRVPNGIYYFYFELRDPADPDHVYDSISKEINIFVPSYLELISPGSSSISDTSSSIIFTTNPVFQWNADYCSQCDYSIRVCQYKPDEHYSIQEAIQDVPILPMETGFYEINSLASVFQYPTTGIEPLLSGNLYVWQIRRSFETTNGVEEELSPVYIFKIQSINTSSSNFLEDDSLDNLKLLIGDSKYNELFGSDGSLENYTTIVPIIFVNQQEMSINYIFDLIELNNNGQINILEIEVE